MNSLRRACCRAAKPNYGIYGFHLCLWFQHHRQNPPILPVAIVSFPGDSPHYISSAGSCCGCQVKTVYHRIHKNGKLFWRNTIEPTDKSCSTRCARLSAKKYIYSHDIPPRRRCGGIPTALLQAKPIQYAATGKVSSSDTVSSKTEHPGNVQTCHRPKTKNWPD